MVTQQTGLSHTILNERILKLLKEPKLNGVQVKLFLKIVAMPPSWPVSLGAFTAL